MNAHIKKRLETLEAQLRGPKRVALFGHRAVGKTTLLAMFYREASTGRVPLVRLAAGDARTAEYLGDRIAQLESGEPIAGTLAETALRLKLYHGMNRLELIVKDYQGEHVALGSEAPIQEFFGDCDAVFFCLDGQAGMEGSAADRQRRQQEIEGLLERYIEGSERARAERPLAILITKYDRVIDQGGPTPDAVEHFFEQHFGMTRHALATHAPQAGVFAVSSYGLAADSSNKPPSVLEPMGLDEPLAWLANRLEAVDRERLEWLFDLAPRDIGRLSRCLAAFERRYPRSAAVIDLRRRLQRLKRRRVALRCVKLATAAVIAFAGVLGYDAWGYHEALRFEQSGRPPREVEQRWADVHRLHPTLPVFFPHDAKTARAKLSEWKVKTAALQVAMGNEPAHLETAIQELKEQAPELAPEIAKVEQAQVDARQERDWRALQVADVAAITDPASHLDAARRFLRDYPDTAHRGEAVRLVKSLESLTAERQARDDRSALDSLVRSAALPGASFVDLITRIERFLSEHPDTTYRPEAEELLEQVVRRADEADIEKARQFSRANPNSFAARRSRYQEYLKAHAGGGRFIAEANAALDRIDRESDAHLYRSAYDHYVAHPDDVPAIAERLRAYLEANPRGQFAEVAREYLAWWERISAPTNYRVVLRRGRVESNVGKPLAGSGPDLGVTLWVAGIEYGPSPVIKDSRSPIWDHTFDTPIRWKYGDPISVRIVDYDWSPSGVFTLTSRAGDKLAMRMLSGTLRPATGGGTELVFASDFHEPKLPSPN